MTEKSLFWYTDGFTGDVGDGAAPYTQEEFRLYNHARIANDVANAGVFANVLNGLAVTGTASPLSMDTGRAICYGFPYWADAAVSLPVTTPAVGTTGGRVVLRASWVGGVASTVRANIIMSSDGVASLPALTQTPFSVWEIPIFSFTVTTGGVIVLIDERLWVVSPPDGITIERNSNGELATAPPDGITIERNLSGELATSDLVARFTERQGGSATDFSSPGTTNYTQGPVAVQLGSFTMPSALDGDVSEATVTFPSAFTYPPVVTAVDRDSGLGTVDKNILLKIVNTTAAGVTFKIYNNQPIPATIRVYWMAIGPR